MKHSPLFISFYYTGVLSFKVHIFSVRYPLFYLFITTSLKLIFSLLLVSVWFVSESSLIYCTPNSDTWAEDYFVGPSTSPPNAPHNDSELPYVQGGEQSSGLNNETKSEQQVGVSSSQSINVVNSSDCIDSNVNNNNNISNNGVNISPQGYNNNSSSRNSFFNIYNSARRRFFWYICESDRNNYETYKDFKSNWDPNLKIRAEIKQELLKDLDKIKLQKHTLSWFLNIRKRPTYR